MSDSVTSGRRSEKEIFFDAMEKNTPEERAAFLDGACGTNPIQRAKVEALLADHFQQDAFMKEPAVDASAPTLPAPSPSEAPANKKIHPRRPLPLVPAKKPHNNDPEHDLSGD